MNLKSVVTIIILALFSIFTTTFLQQIAQEKNENLLEENELHPHLINQPAPTTTYDVEDKTSGCVRLSTQAAGHAKYRIVVYQKQGGQQLVDILVHYLQALTYDEIVVIANEDGDVLEDTPMYKEFMLKGIHLWQCLGTRNDKGVLWTQVIEQYKEASDFIQPTDVDEYLALVSPTDDTSLVWDRPSLHSALDELPVSNGKPYKTLDSKPVPLDCIESPGDNGFQHLKHQARHCNIAGFSEAKGGCYNKNFYRSEHFKEVDIGNHYGVVDSIKKCEKEGIEAAFEPTKFVLVHYQTLDFQDWLVHALRMATDAEFNKLVLDECPEGHNKPWHSCAIFKQFLDVKFDLYKMRELYKNKMCWMRPHVKADGIRRTSC